MLAAKSIPAIHQPWRAEAFGNDHPKPRCFHRRLWVVHDPTDDFLAVAHIVIVIAAATALVSANESKVGLRHIQAITAQGKVIEFAALSTGGGFFLPATPSLNPGIAHRIDHSYCAARYLLKELTTATTTITLTTKSAHIASFEIWSRAQSIISALSFCSGWLFGSNIFHAVIELFAAVIETILLTGKVIPFGDTIRCLPDCTKAKQRFGLAFIGAARQKQCQTDNNDVYQNGVSSAFSHRAYLQQHAALTCLPITSSLKTSRQSAGDFGFLDLDYPLLRSLLRVKRTSAVCAANVRF